MIRQIIKIDSEKCNGCGACVKACHEGAIAMIDGKAKLTRDDYCDGLGNCLPACPTNAITFENREAKEFDEIAVKKHMDNRPQLASQSGQSHTNSKGDKLPCGCPSTSSVSFNKTEKAEVQTRLGKETKLPCGCPSTSSVSFNKTEKAEVQTRLGKETKLPCGCPSTSSVSFNKTEKAEVQTRLGKETKLPCGCPSTAAMTIDKNVKTEDKPNQNELQNYHGKAESELRQFPIQIKLVSPAAPYFEGCDLLVAADCTAFAYGNFHQDFIKGKITLIGCPKLDEGDYSDKLTEILVANDINSLTVVRMEVPCCGGIVQAVKTALKNSEKVIPWQIITISRSGEIVK